MKKFILVMSVFLSLMNISDNLYAKSSKQGSAEKVIRWTEKTKWSESRYINGNLIETINHGGLKVAASLSDDGWKIQAAIGVTNKSGKRIDVLPKKFTLNVVFPKPKSLAYQSPEKLVKSINSSMIWAAALTGLSSGLATDTSYVTTSTPYGSYTSTITTPNYMAQYNAQQQINLAAQDAGQQITTINRNALRENTLLPGQSVAGLIWFNRTRNKEQVILKVPVNGVTYEFPFSWPKARVKQAPKGRV